MCVCERQQRETQACARELLSASAQVNGDTVGRALFVTGRNFDSYRPEKVSTLKSHRIADAQALRARGGYSSWNFNTFASKSAGQNN